MQYAPFVLAAFQMDAEWSRLHDGVGAEVFEQLRDDVDSRCRRYGSEIQQNFSKMCQSGRNHIKSEPLHTSAYSPLHYAIFGRADHLVLAVFDDFDPVHAIASEIKNGVADLSVGLCPSFGSNHRLLAVEQIFEPTTLATLPLITFTKFKLDGIGLMCGGCRFHAGVLTAIESLYQKCNDHGESKSVVVDLLGLEEIGLLTFCRNYSDAMSLVYRLRSLTYGSLTDSTSLEESASSIIGRKVSLKNNHLFRWTDSCLGISSKEMWSESMFNNVCGNLHATLNITVSPGHEQAIMEYPLVDESGNHELDESLFVCTGREDIRIELGNRTAKSVISTKALIRTVRDFVTSCGKSDKKNRWRDITEIVTHLEIPIAVESAGRPVEKHDAIALELLPKLQATILRRLAQLRTVPKQAGVPVVLRRIIEHLYQVVSVHLNDPLAWDSVLDLWDSLDGFHATLTQLGKELDSLHYCMIESDAVRELANFATVLADAISHRTASANNRRIDMALDFRGGFEQLLHSANGVTQLALEIWKSLRTRREPIGTPTLVSFFPGTRAFYSKVGPGPPMTYIEADVPHVLNVATFCDYFHEVAHLIFKDIAVESGDPSPISGLENGLVGEVFAHTFTLRLVFGNDKSTFVTHYLNTFHMHVAGAGSIEQTKDDDLLLRLSDFLNEAHLAISISHQLCSLRSRDPRFDKVEFEETLDSCWPLLGDSTMWRDHRGTLKEFLVSRYRLASQEFQKHWKNIKNIWLGVFERDLGDFNHDIPRKIKKNANNAINELAGYIGFLNQDGFGNLPSDRDKQTDKTRTRFILPRDGGKEFRGKITFANNDDAGSFAPFLVDRGGNARFCAIPRMRCERLLRQANLIKSFWGIATELRGMQLRKILESYDTGK